MTLDRAKLKKLGLKVVEPTPEDEKGATVHFVSKDAVAAVKGSLGKEGDGKS